MAEIRPDEGERKTEAGSWEVIPPKEKKTLVGFQRMNKKIF